MELQPHKYYKKRIAELEQKMAVALDKMELVQKELFLEDDYRTQNLRNNQRIFYPLNEKILFKII